MICIACQVINVGLIHLLSYSLLAEICPERQRPGIAAVDFFDFFDFFLAERESNYVLMV